MATPARLALLLLAAGTLLLLAGCGGDDSDDGGPQDAEPPGLEEREPAPGEPGGAAPPGRQGSGPAPGAPGALPPGFAECMADQGFPVEPDTDIGELLHGGGAPPAAVGACFQALHQGGGAP